MTVTINGTTGIDKVQDGSIQAADLASGVPSRSQLPAGTVLQVVQTFCTTAFATSSNSMTDITGMSISITPTSSTSKILLMTSISTSKTTNDYAIAFQWLRNGSATGVGTLATGSAPNYSFSYTQFSANSINNVNSQYLDSPATTSAVTYKLQVRVQSGGGTFSINNSPSYLNASPYDVYNGAYTSTVTAIEVSA